MSVFDTPLHQNPNISGFLSLRHTRYHIMAKKSKSKSDKSEDTKSNGAVAAVSTTLKTDAPVDPLLASLFEKSVSFPLECELSYNCDLGC